MYKKISNSWLKHWDFIALDLLFLQAAYALSYVLRNGLSNPYENPVYRNIGIILCLLDICTAFFLENYRGIMRRGYIQELKAVIKHVTVIAAAEVIYLFLSRSGEQISRSFFIVFIADAVFLLYCERVLWKAYLLKHKKIFYNKRALLILTTSDIAEDVLRTVQGNTYNELEIIGAVIMNRNDLVGTQTAGIPIVCRSSEIFDYMQTRWVDGVLVNMTKLDYLPDQFTSTCVKMGITVHKKIAEIKESIKNQQLDNLGGYVVLSTNIRMATSRQLFVKRAMDICGALVGLVLTGIFTVVLAPAIYAASPGPIFFSQVRVGRNGRKFKIYKFRSMYMDAEKRKQELKEKNQMNGYMFKLDTDPRIIGSGADGTRHGLGWFIRKTSIDEFPQFLNILKGDMSLVGTRPPTVDEWEQYAYHHRGRMATKPRLTGLWQVCGRSNITDFEEVVRLDVEYIQKWNLALDIKILLKTIVVVCKGQGSK